MHERLRLTGVQPLTSYLRRQHFNKITQMKDAKTFTKAKFRMTPKRDAKTEP